MKIDLFPNIALIAQLAVHLTFVPEDPGSNPARDIFFSCFFNIFEKIRVSSSFFRASKATESSKKLKDKILSILGGH